MTRAEQWIKLHARDLVDPRRLRLTWSERGMLDAASLYAKAYSEVPGYFVQNGRPLTAEDIALGIGAATPADRRAVVAAFRAFEREDLMNHDTTLGYDIQGWDSTQSGVNTEGREAWRRRKRNQRARTKASETATVRRALANRVIHRAAGDAGESSP